MSRWFSVLAHVCVFVSISEIAHSGALHGSGCEVIDSRPCEPAPAYDVALSSNLAKSRTITILGFVQTLQNGH
jgi:hypothetical protein